MVRIPDSGTNLNILRRLEARGTLSVWQISAKVTTTSSRGKSTNSFSGEYSSCGIIRSCKNLVRNLKSKSTCDSQYQHYLAKR